MKIPVVDPSDASTWPYKLEVKHHRNPLYFVVWLVRLVRERLLFHVLV